MKSREKRDCWIYAICMMILAEAFSWFQPIYTNVDNFITSMVISAVYDKDTYSMVLNPVLCWIMSFVGKVLPTADAFTLVTKIVLLAGIGSISYFVALHFRHWPERLFAGAMLFLLTIEMNLFSDYFMVWAAFFTFVGMVWLLRSMKTGVHGSWIAAGTFFICCGLMWRLGGFVPFIPFLLLGWGMDFLFESRGKEEKLQYLKKTVRVFGPMMICFVLLLGIDYGYKHSEKYEDSVNFCDVVSTIVDYPMEDYETVEKLLPESVTENDYNSLTNAMYADTERITTEYCQQIADVGKKDEIVINPKDIFQKTYSLVARLYGLKNFRVWCIGLVLLAFGILLSEAAWYEKLEIVFAGGGAYLMMLYLMLVGRLPERGMQVMLYAAMGILLVRTASIRNEKKIHRIKMLLIVVFLSLVSLDLPSISFSGHQSLFTAKIGADEVKWEQTYEPEDAVYLWRTKEHRKRAMRDYMAQGKLLSENFMNHNLADGGWDFNQVYSKGQMERLGVPNPIRALAERPHTYYVAEDCNAVLTYIREHYDEKVQAVQVDELDGIPVWQFQ